MCRRSVVLTENQFAVPCAQICSLSATLAGANPAWRLCAVQMSGARSKITLAARSQSRIRTRSISWFDWETSSSPITVSLTAPLREPLGMDAIDRAAATFFEFLASMDERLCWLLASVQEPMQPLAQHMPYQSRHFKKKVLNTRT